MTLPEISLPTAKPMLSPPFLKALLSKRSRKNTVCFCLFGTSIPIADFPGIGASILISLAASASFISFASDNTLDTLTPCSGLSSYSVTDGPILISSTVTFTSKLAKVSCNVMAVCLYSLSEST